MNRSSISAALAVLVVFISLAVSGCTSADAESDPQGRALANSKTGEACRFLAGAEANPVGSKDEVIGEAQLAHAKTLALRASEAHSAWASFNKDMQAIGKDGGLPALKRVTAVCKQWSEDRTYYLEHDPKG